MAGNEMSIQTECGAVLAILFRLRNDTFFFYSTNIYYRRSQLHF
jgi:hypothetical protein